MPLTTKILNNAGSGTVNSTDAGQYGTSSPHPNFVNGILYPQRVVDKAGIMQIKAQSGLTGTVTIQGRMSTNDAWYDIASATQADWNTDAQYSWVEQITLFPQMRAVSVISAGSPSISVWITE